MSILSLYAEKMVLNCVNIYILILTPCGGSESSHYINELSLKCYRVVNLCSSIITIELMTQFKNQQRVIGK